MRSVLSSFIGGVALAAVFATSAFSANTLGPLVTPEQVAVARDSQNAVIIDIRGEADGFIPGSIQAPYGKWRGPATNPGELISVETLNALLNSLGLTEQSKVIIAYQGKDETDFGAAARVYWTLKSAGLENLAVLNGGVNAWVAAGQTLAPVAATPIASNATFTWNSAWTASREDVVSVVEGKTKATLLDSRPEAFYKGETAHQAAKTPGTLPHAQIFTHSNFFQSGPALVEASAAKELVSKANIAADQPVVSFCNTGHWAATNWFALSEVAGLQDVKLYPESMVGWSNAGLPMDNTPSRLDHLIKSVKGLL